MSNHVFRTKERFNGLEVVLRFAQDSAINKLSGSVMCRSVSSHASTLIMRAVHDCETFLNLTSTLVTARQGSSAICRSVSALSLMPVADTSSD
jgi:hypothetical protein